MRGPVTVHQVDVFTRAPFAGNAAAVVLDADGLEDDLMQAIAREMNLSETAFVSSPAADGSVPVRFFTPSREVPLCGHATLAAQFVRARALGLDRGEVVQASPGGRWTVRWAPRDGATFLVMEQGPVERGAVWSGAPLVRLLEALGTEQAELVEDWPVQTLSTGHAKALVPLARPGRLLALEPDMGALARLSADTGIDGWFVFAPREDHTGTTARMFGPALGIPEDPVNGSGHGPLGAYLCDRGGVAARSAREGFWSGMGAHLGRAGEVWVQARVDGSVVDVGGFVTPVLEGTISTEVA